MRGRLLLSTAAALALTVCAWLLFPSSPYSTAIGEQRTVQLEDGSVLQLNTRSKVRVRLSDSAREVDLLEGEALFKVAPDAARPFRVHAGDSVIQVLGTQFNVYRKAGGLTVSVLEGKVAVAGTDGQSTVLAAGEEARMTAGGATYKQTADIPGATAWRQRRLVFKVTPLTDVVGEFNRYNRSLRLRLEAIDGRQRHYTGTFDADDPESLAQLLAQDPTLSVRHVSNEIVIGPR